MTATTDNGIAGTAAAKLSSIDLTKKKLWLFQLSDNMRVKPQGVTEQGDYDPPYPRSYKILNPVQTIDTKTGAPRWARALKGIDTIWMDEQKDIPKEALATMNEEFDFTDGSLNITTPFESTRVKFLLVHPDLEENRAISPDGRLPRFKLLNSEEKAKADMLKAENKTNAEKAALEADIEVLKMLSKEFDVSLVGINGDLSETEIRLAFVKKAGEQPDLILSKLNTPVTKISAIVKEAIDGKVIDLEHVKGQAHWADTKAMICVLDEGKDPIDVLTTFALGKKKESKDFMKKLTQ